MILTPMEYLTFLRTDLISFITRAFFELKPQEVLKMSPYIELLASKLEDCRHGRIKRLIINLPPRHLKSHCVTVSFVAWLLGQDPSCNIICASYGYDLTEKLARECRAIMQSGWYQTIFSTRLSPERKAVHDFDTTARGSRMATSVGGPLTGRGGDFIILDDPMKPEEALSESQRKSTNDWYDNTLLSRLNDKEQGCIIIVMQRLHQDDLVGHVLEQENWEVLSFPAIAEQDEAIEFATPLGKTLFRRRKGEVLHAQRESKVTLDNIRKTIGDYNFSAQYQQSPIPLGGAMVKTEWLRYYDPEETLPRFSSYLQSWDTANKAGELNDYSVCTTWGVYGKHFYLLDVRRKRMDYPTLKRTIIDHAKRYEGTKILIEDKASGTQLLQELRTEIYGLKGYEPPTGMDKIMRLHAQTDLFENGFVFLPTSAPWLNDYVLELTTFPGSKYDDQVDSTTQALDHLRKYNKIDMWERLGR